MNEYLTDYLWRFNETNTIYDFDAISKILNYKGNIITKNYLSKMANENNTKLRNNDVNIIFKDFIDNLKEELKILFKNQTILKQEKTAYKKLQLDLTNINGKLKSNYDKINNIEVIHQRIISYSSKEYVPRSNVKKNKIINTYDKLLNDKYGVYSSIWKLLFDNENLLK
jgi:hypothetical protein